MSEALADPSPEADVDPTAADATATADAPAVDQPAAYDGPTCEKCGARTSAAACPACGWYPSINAYVEIDDTYERLMATVEVPEEETAAETKPEWQKHLEVWQGAIPMWGWGLLATTGVVVALAITARVLTLAAPGVQTTIGVVGLLAGLVVLLVTHLVGFVLCSGEDATLGMTDALIKPFNVWKQLLSDLPRRWWVVNTANGALTTALAAALIVGGIPYERLLDWGFKAAPKKTLVAMIAEQAAKSGGNGSDSLEGAIGDFAGEAGDPGEAGDGKPTPPAEEAIPRERLECLIVGYRLNDKEKLSQLLLASDVAGRLKYVGAVAPPTEADEAAELLASFQGSLATRAFVRTSESALWLRPRFTCRVTYTKWPKGKRPRDLEWDELLDEVKLPW